MKLYDSLSKKQQEIEPQNPPSVTIYTCGPTVYDYQHVGNWFTYLRYDLLIRTLKSAGFHPQWVLNITDVGHLVSDADEGEDKLEKGARREGKTAWEVAKLYTEDFLQGLTGLNISQPDYLPKATDHIAEQLEFVAKLEKLGYTYVIDDGVYYNTAKFPRYAELAKLDLDELQPSQRVNPNPQKRNPSDFALWKFSPKDHQRDMEWDSPWGKGFPGWHLECSAMALKYLGETIDIHCGGIDHLPVHHTNEIAQSEAVTGKPLAKYWMHTNHILFDQHKMAKSLGNTVTLQDIKDKGLDLQALRLLALQSHYKTQSKFSWNELEAAQSRLRDFQALAALRWQANSNKASINQDLLNDVNNAVAAAMQADLNSPLALAALNRVISELPNGLAAKDLPAFNDFLEQLDRLLGLELASSSDITEAQKALIAEREQARTNQDWPRADELRAKLLEQGIELNDTASGPLWSRTN